MTRYVWGIVALCLLGALFFPWLLIFGAFIAIVAVVGALTGGGKR
jgi:hypothetical protein